VIRMALEVDRLSFRYPGAERDSLRDVTVDLEEGAFVLATGPTGAGKSTFLRAANGLVPHFSGGTFTGRVLAAGRDTTKEPPRRLADIVAFVPQDPAAAFVLGVVEDEIAYGMENLGVDPRHMRRRVEEMLDLLSLEPLRRRGLRSLSGGEQQRVAIAGALAAGPRILVLDEPTSQLDPQAAEDVVAALQRLVHDQGVTVLVAEHRLERVAGFVDQALGFDDGRIIVGSPAEIIGASGLGPPVARLGSMLGWTPVPLTVREARRRGNGMPVGRRIEPAPPGEPLLTVRGVDARHGDRPALHGVDVAVSRGEILGVMGRNGAGKTTLLRTMAGVHRPARGEVRMGTEPPRTGVDVVLGPQRPESVLFADSVLDEVRATLTARGRDPGSAHEVLEALGIRDLAPFHPRDCSAGERLLVAVAAVAAAGPPVVLLDEPTRGLDAAVKRRLIGFLRAHAARGGAVALATHDVELVAAVATRVVILAAGEVIAEGDPATVLGDSMVFAPQMTRAFGPGWLTPEQVAGAMA
jgi:energy-coupling factor transport system ATP-binding protein